MRRLKCWWIILIVLLLMLTPSSTAEANNDPDGLGSVDTPVTPSEDPATIDLSTIPLFSTHLIYTGQSSPHTGYVIHPSRLAQVRISLLDLERCEASRDACYGRLKALPVPEPCPDADSLAMWRGVGCGLLVGIVGGLVLGVVAVQ